jgi:hypothetical protein
VRTDTSLAALRDCRDDLYACLYRRAPDGGALPSPVHLSGDPAHWSGRGSLNAALSHGRLDETRLRALFACQSLPGGQPDYAVNCSVWARCDAEASPKRGYYHPSRHSTGRPIVAGWNYQWLAQVGFAPRAEPPRSMYNAPTRTRTPPPSSSRRSPGASASPGR